LNDLNSNINNIKWEDVFNEKNYNAVTQNINTITIVADKIKSF
jgi:hypothetical protein